MLFKQFFGDGFDIITQLQVTAMHQGYCIPQVIFPFDKFGIDHRIDSGL